MRPKRKNKKQITLSALRKLTPKNIYIYATVCICEKCAAEYTLFDACIDRYFAGDKSKYFLEVFLPDVTIIRYK